jgi:hypothetical protein
MLTGSLVSAAAHGSPLSQELFELEPALKRDALGRASMCLLLSFRRDIRRGELLKLRDQPVQVSMQAGPVYLSNYPNDQIGRRQLVLRGSEPVPYDPLDPIPPTRPGHSLLADDEAQASVVHSIENQVQT